MKFLDLLFKTKKETTKEVVHSEIYTKTVQLLLNDFPNWKKGIVGTYVHLPTRIGIATTGKSAFVYIECNTFNARSGKYVDLVSPEPQNLYEVFRKIVSSIEEKEQKIINEKALQVLNDYTGEPK